MQTYQLSGEIEDKDQYKNRQRQRQALNTTRPPIQLFGKDHADISAFRSRQGQRHVQKQMYRQRQRQTLKLSGNAHATISTLTKI